MELTDICIPETYNKYFTFERDYIFRWNLTRSLNFNLTATNNSRIDEPDGRIDTKAKRDSVWGNFLKGGRNTLYNQTTNFSYTLPTAKFPLTDWTTVNIKYQATYNWIAASLLAPELGNILENGQQQEITVQGDLTRLYGKSKWLRALEQPKPKQTTEENFTTRTDTVFRHMTIDGQKIKEVKKLKVIKISNPNSVPQMSMAERVFGKLLTSIKQVNASISENANTRLPGYTDSTQFVGQNFRSMQPGFGFILGQQPDTNWLNHAAQKGLIAKDSGLSDLFQQSYNQRITVSAQLEPVKGLNITISASKSFNKNYSELFKTQPEQEINSFGHLSPYTGGGFDISFISYKTLFGSFNPNQVSQTFLNFEQYRQTISQRWGKLNPNSASVVSGYATGYDQYATDVLIPAFIAAYSGKDPNKIALINENNPNIKSNPFSGFLPEPNWKLDYNGLSKITQASIKYLPALPYLMLIQVT